jgi:hypothetical protein
MLYSLAAAHAAQHEMFADSFSSLFRSGMGEKSENVAVVAHQKLDNALKNRSRRSRSSYKIDRSHKNIHAAPRTTWI